MRQFALGLIETVGYATAVSAADAALKAANVALVGVERVIGVGGALGVTIQLSGDVGAVQSAVEAGRMEAEKVGRIISAHVIPRTHLEVNEKLLPFFSLDRTEKKEDPTQELPKRMTEWEVQESKKESKNKEKKSTKEKTVTSDTNHYSDASGNPEGQPLNENLEQ